MLRGRASIPAEGFHWADRRLSTPPGSKKERFLVPTPSTQSPAIYDCFSERPLFKRFASVHTTEEGILEFANQFGFLGGFCLKTVLEPDAKESNRYWDAPGERFEDWVKHIGLMKHAVVDLWENIRDGYAARTAKFIRWEKTIDGNRVHYVAPEIPGWKRSSFLILDQRHDIFSQVRHGDTLRPAWLALLQIVNVELARHLCAAQLSDDTTSERFGATFAVYPEGLLGALWLQFARAIADNPEYRRCEDCGYDFEITGDKRADARYCSPACRLRAHRKRVKGNTTKPPRSRRK
jgi:hypothetical protein